MGIRTITRYAVDCDFCEETFDDSVCPDVVGKTRSQVTRLALAAGWEVVPFQRHRCPVCRELHPNAVIEPGTLGHRRD